MDQVTMATTSSQWTSVLAGQHSQAANVGLLVKSHATGEINLHRLDGHARERLKRILTRILGDGY